MEAKLRETVKKLFADGRINILVGHEKGTLPLLARPVIIRSADEVDKLVWNRFCTNNLAVYIPRFFEPKKVRKGETPPPLPKVGMVAKGCDARSIIGLVREHQAPRGNVVIIGMPCEGMVDTSKVVTLLSGDVIVAGGEDEGALVVTGRAGKKQKAKVEDVLLDACLGCNFPVPDGADVSIEGPARKPAGGKYTAAKEFGAKSFEERWKHFSAEISKCIRCYACRQACPNCYCKDCFADQTNPRWLGTSDDLSETMLFHIGRIFHQAGRCVECDACARACPMGIDIRTFTQKVAQDVKELFGYTPDFSADSLPPLCAFKQDDGQEFITEP